MESDFPQVLGCEPNVDTSALQRPVPQKIAYGLQGQTAPKQIKSIGVPQTVSSFVGDIESTPFGPPLEGFDHCCGFENAPGSPDAKKDLPVVAISGNSREIVMDGRAHFIRERKLQGIAGLRLANLDTPLTPFYMVELQSHYVAGTQAVSRNEREHGVVSLPHGGVPVYGKEECLNRFPWQGSGELLLSVNTRRIDLALQPKRHYSTGSQEAEEIANRRYYLLKGYPAHSFSHLPNEALDVFDLEERQSVMCLLEFQTVEKLRDYDSLSLNGSRSVPTIVSQVSNECVQLNLFGASF